MMFRQLPKECALSPVCSLLLLVFILGAPIPKGKVHTKLQPRLGENATLKIEDYGYPTPLYTWYFNGTVLKNESTGNTDDYEVPTVRIADFGMYKLEMSNDLGTSVVNYSLEAYGTYNFIHYMYSRTS